MTQPIEGQVYQASNGYWYRWPNPQPFSTSEAANGSPSALTDAFAPPPPLPPAAPGWTQELASPGARPPAANSWVPPAGSGTASSNTAIAWVIAVVTFGYMIPWAIAESRGKPNAGAIAAVNFLAGWTIIGWIAALVMACTENRASATTTVYYIAQPGLPPSPLLPTSQPPPLPPAQPSHWTNG